MTEVLIDPTVKLGPVVGDDCSGDAEPAYNILPDKLSNILIFDRGECFDLDPLTEIVCGHQ